MKKGNRLEIFTVVALIVVIIAIFIGSYLVFQEANEEQERLKEGCEIYVVSSLKAPIDCFAYRFRERMNDANLTATYCFMTRDNNIFLTCDWEAKGYITQRSENVKG